MTVRKRGNSYLADFRISGVRYRETFAVCAEAEAWELDARAAAKRGEVAPTPYHKPKGGITYVSPARQLGAIFDHLLKHHWGARFPRSLHTARSLTNILCDCFVWETDISEITKVAIEEATEEWREAVSNETINRRLSTLSVALKHAESMGYIQAAPRPAFMPHSPGRTRIVSEEEEARLIEWFRTNGHPIMAAFVTFQIETGLRPSEALRAEWGHFDVDLGGVRVTSTTARGQAVGKTEAAERYVSLSPSAVDAVLRLKQSFSNLPGPFWQLRHPRLGETRMNYATGLKPWQDMQKALGLGDLIMYTMRHTCATRLCRDMKSAEDVRIAAVKQWMGHSSLGMTMKYVHPDHADIRNLMLRREASKGLISGRFRVV